MPTYYRLLFFTIEFEVLHCPFFSLCRWNSFIKLRFKKNFFPEYYGTLSNKERIRSSLVYIKCNYTRLQTAAYTFFNDPQIIYTLDTVHIRNYYKNNFKRNQIRFENCYPFEAYNGYHDPIILFAATYRTRYVLNLKVSSSTQKSGYLSGPRALRSVLCFQISNKIKWLFNHLS